MAAAGAGVGAGAGAGDAGAAKVTPRTRKQVVDDMSPEAARAWLAGIDTVLVDCDGVMWRGATHIPGAADTIVALRAAGKRVVFVTNNSTKSRTQYVAKMKAMGVDVTTQDIMSTAYCTAAWLKRQGVPKTAPKVYLIGEEGLKTELEAVGCTVSGLEDKREAFPFGSLGTADFVDADLGAVVVGFDREFNYNKLARAVMSLRANPKARFVSTNPDSTFPDGDMILPGGGLNTVAVAAALGRPADIVIGKPGPTMLDQLKADLELEDLSKAMMIGDRLNTDIAFGNSRAGHTMLVMTGVTQPSDLDSIPDPAQVPTHIASSIAVLKDLC